MATLEEIRAARQKDAMRQQIRAARAADRARTTPDGRSVAPGTSAEDAARVPPGMVYDPQTGGYADAAAIAQRKGPAMGALGNFAAGGVFVGEGVDEAIGAMRGEVAQEVARQSVQQYQEQHPVAAGALRFAGGMASAAPIGGVGAGMVAKAPGPLLKGAAALTAGAVAGSMEGASSGYLRGRTPQQRQKMAQGDAVIGGAVGAGAAGVGLAAAPLGKAMIQRVRKMDLSVIASEFGISPKAARLIKRYLINDDLDAAQDLLARSGDDAMLADAGPGTAAALDAAAQTGGAPLRIARDAVEARAAATQPKLVKMLDDVLGAPEGRRAANKAVNSKSAAARTAAYDAAYGSPIDYASQQGRDIEAVLERVSPKVMRKAVDEANDAMRDSGAKNMQIMAQISDDGSVSFQSMPDVRQLDYLKRALGDIAEEGRDSITGQVSDAGRRAGNQARDLRDAISAAVPEYQRALKLGGDTIAERESLRLGADILSPRTTVEDVREWAKTASTADREAVRQGLRQEIEKRMGDVRSTVSDSATDARESIKAALDVSSRNARAKLRIALGDDADKFFSGMDQSRAALELRAAISANSKTAIRQSGREAVNEILEPNALQSMLTGRVGAAVEKTAGAVTGVGKMPTEQREKILSEIATALTQIRGRKAQKALATVRRAMNGQRVTDEMAAQAAKVIGGQSFNLSYQGLSLLPEKTGSSQSLPR